MTEAAFEVDVDFDDARAFAELSGDWNPLHTDESYAKQTQYGRPILHGAFSAGLVSRVAGMYIPGTDCLLHSIQLKFLQPILPPARLSVRAKLTSERGNEGRVAVEISDAATGRRYVEASYEFGRHQLAGETAKPLNAAPTGDAITLVTGAAGGIGKALLGRLGASAVGISRTGRGGLPTIQEISDGGAYGNSPIAGIIHLGWPAPDNARLTKLANIDASVDYNVSEPMKEAIALSQLMAKRGTPDALLLLVGSTAADPGRHNYRMPLYTIAKSTIPVLARVLAVELGPTGRRCAAVVFDVVGTGMNDAMSPQARMAHESRSPFGEIPSADDAADQLVWMMSNRNMLLSGATITLSGGALP